MSRLAAKDAEARCGLMMIDLHTGNVVNWLELHGIVTELYDVQVLPGVRCPMALGFKTDEVRRIITIDQSPSVVLHTLSVLDGPKPQPAPPAPVQKGAQRRPARDGDYKYHLSMDMTAAAAVKEYEALTFPSFVEQPGLVTNPLGMVGAAYPQYAFLTKPTFVDIDGDGDFDAFVGHYDYSYYGNNYYDSVRFFRNTGDNQNPTFVEQAGAGPGNNPLYMVNAHYTALTFVDIDGDGDFDAFLGHKYGGGYYDSVRYFENAPVPVGGVTEPASALALLGPWLVSAAAGVTGAIGAGAALLSRQRRKA